MVESSLHVVARAHGGWAVRHTGASRASKTFSDRDSAIAYARDRARKARGRLYIHAPDGTVKRRDSYGGEPVSSER